VAVSPSFDAAPFIKDIGRGRDNPSDLDEARAKLLWDAVLGEQLDPVALGGVLIAMRVKGESVAEMGGFLLACDDRSVPIAALPGQPMPVVIPSYNGARKLVNLTPLLAMLLARRGIQVLVHGSSGGRDIPAGRALRVTSAEIFAAAGYPLARSQADIHMRWHRGEAAFIDLVDLHPQLARVLAMRRVLGVRNSAHSLAKLLQPIDAHALCLSSYTHPEYHQMLAALLSSASISARRDAFLLRATEGEPVCNVRRAVPIEWYRNGRCTVLEPLQGDVMVTPPGLPAGNGVAETINYMEAVLTDRLPVPEPIAWQIDAIVKARAVHLKDTA
jgi:anthranilate phosphoribosyltransferase